MFHREPSTTFCRSWLACCLASRGAACLVCSSSWRSGSLSLWSLPTVSYCELSQCLSERLFAQSVTRCFSRQRTCYVISQSDVLSSHYSITVTMATTTSTTISSSSRLSSGLDMSSECTDRSVSGRSTDSRTQDCILHPFIMMSKSE